jgi:hypothetical protein
MKTKLFLISFAFVFAFSSCKDDKDEDPEPVVITEQPVASDPSKSIIFNDYAGSVIAVESISEAPFGGFQITIGTAVASFVNTNGELQNVGKVTVEGNDLNRLEGNAYVRTAGLTEPNGVEFDGAVEWTVEGNGDIPAGDFENRNGFPEIVDIIGEGTLSKSAGYTLSTSSINNADSVIFVVGNVTKVVSGSTKSYSFTPEELAGLKNGTQYVSIAPYNFVMAQRISDTRKIYAVNESVVQKTVEIQD